MRALIIVGTVALALAACTTTGEIDGYKVRGTAEPETPVEQAAREFNEDWAEKIGPMIEDDPQVQEAVREILAERAASENPGDLHARAPQWFRDRWRQYLKIADGGYAVLAADRNGRGTGYVYCDPGSGALCDSHHRWTAAFKDANYKYPALRYCFNDVRNNYPAEKPDCAVYAIKDAIVWEGAMPWE